MRGKSRIIRELQKDYELLRRDFERSISKLELSLETELKIISSLDNIEKLIKKLDKINEVCYNN